MRRSTRRLDQITPANVSTLAQAWTYPSGGAAPIVIDNTMYFVAAGHVVALNATTGTEVWKFALSEAAPGGAIRRGMTYWPGAASQPPRVLVTMSGGKLVQLDAKTGTLVPQAGVIDLVAGIMDRIPGGEAYTIASPVAVYKNVAIFPGRTGEHNRWGIPGDLRGFDLLTGKELWRFHTVPHPGEPNFGTWGMNGWQDRKGPGSWQPLTVDNANGLVFVALGNAVDQNYGNSRPGSNLYSASVVALDAATGKYKWHFQTAHHDIYDGDLNAPPMFADVTQNGKKVPAIVQMTKVGLLFFLNRLTGEPIFGVEERPVPPTDALGDAAWPTQPFPVKPEPITRLSMTRAEVSKISPEAEKYCMEIYDQAVQMGPVHALRHGPQHLVSRIDRWRQQQRRLVRSGARDGVRHGTPRRDDRPAVRDAVVRRPAVIRQDQDAFRLLPRSRRLPVQRPALGGVVRHQRKHRRHRVARSPWRIQGARRERHSEDRHGYQHRRSRGDWRWCRVHRRHVGRPVPRLRRDDWQRAVVRESRVQRDRQCRGLQGRERQAVRGDLGAAHDCVRAAVGLRGFSSQFQVSSFQLAPVLGTGRNWQLGTGNWNCDGGCDVQEGPHRALDECPDGDVGLCAGRAATTRWCRRCWKPGASRWRRAGRWSCWPGWWRRWGRWVSDAGTVGRDVAACEGVR